MLRNLHLFFQEFSPLPFYFTSKSQSIEIIKKQQTNLISLEFLRIWKIHCLEITKISNLVWINYKYKKIV